MIPGLVIHVAALAHGRLAAHGTIAVTVKTRAGLHLLTALCSGRHARRHGEGLSRSHLYPFFDSVVEHHLMTNIICELPEHQRAWWG
jgi:hypothetical protein